LRRKAQELDWGPPSWSRCRLLRRDRKTVSRRSNHLPARRRDRRSTDAASPGGRTGTWCATRAFRRSKEEMSGDSAGSNSTPVELVDRGVFVSNRSAIKNRLEPQRHGRYRLAATGAAVTALLVAFLGPNVEGQRRSTGPATLAIMVT